VGPAGATIGGRGGLRGRPPAEGAPAGAARAARAARAEESLPRRTPPMPGAAMSAAERRDRMAAMSLGSNDSCLRWARLLDWTGGCNCTGNRGREPCYLSSAAPMQAITVVSESRLAETPLPLPRALLKEPGERQARWHSERARIRTIAAAPAGAGKNDRRWEYPVRSVIPPHASTGWSFPRAKRPTHVQHNNMQQLFGRRHPRDAKDRGATPRARARDKGERRRGCCQKKFDADKTRTCAGKPQAISSRSPCTDSCEKTAWLQHQ
jgi:hypothetical protein